MVLTNNVLVDINQNFGCHNLNVKIQYKCDLNNQSIKLDEYQQRAVVQIEKYQLLTERAAVEREELQQQNRAAQVPTFIFYYIYT